MGVELIVILMFVTLLIGIGLGIPVASVLLGTAAIFGWQLCCRQTISSDL